MHPEHGQIPPDEFIHIAETTGQIDSLTNQVLRIAMAQIARWQQQGFFITVAVNISAINLKQADFDTHIMAMLAEFQLDTTAITLEITESALAEDPEKAVAMLKRLSSQGLIISIDDYGTGYSSLSQLKHLPARELKIDKAFILNVAEDKYDQKIALSTMRLAHQFGLQTVAEGVEAQATLDWLSRHGCEYAQGYFISRPLPTEEFTDYLRQQPASMPGAADNI